MALTDEQKRGILQTRIQQFEAELYQHGLNRLTAEAVGLPTTESDAAIEQLNKAIEVHETELAVLAPAEVEA